jgi:hypothetical protein
MSSWHERMSQDYDPCDHGLDSDCCACAIVQLERQAEADEAEIVLLQGLLRQVWQALPPALAKARGTVREAERYLRERGLL